MTRTITQEMFDEIVKENMEEFEMTEEEAVEEAKKQFKAQGVNLANIIMGCSTAAIVSHCVKSLQKLLIQNYPDRDADISYELNIIKVELDKELSVRVRAGKEGLYPVLINCLSKMAPQYLFQVLETLTSLTNGYPDLLDKSGLDFMMGFLNTNVDIELILQNLKWIKNCVTAHEKNRSELFVLKIQSSFRQLLQEFKDRTVLIIQICQVTRKLVSDDDIRVAHGNPHEHARELAMETLCLFISLLKAYENDACTLNELIPTITSLVVRDEFCIKVYERNGLRYILDTMIKFPDDERINRNCLCLLKSLAGSDYVKEPIIKNGAAPLIISTMYRHKISPSLVAAGCVCISALALRCPCNAQCLVEAGSPELLITVMNMYKDNPVILSYHVRMVADSVGRESTAEAPRVLVLTAFGERRSSTAAGSTEDEKNGCWAIRNTVARSHEFRAKFTALGAEMLLNEARKKFAKELDFEAKIALKELVGHVEDDFWPKSPASGVTQS